MLRRPLVALAVAGCLAAASFASLSQAATRRAPSGALLTKAAATPQGVLPEPLARPSTADRYAPANGCFAVRSASGAAVPGGPFLFHAFDLGKYPLVAPSGAFLSTAADPLPTREAAALARGFVDGTGDERIQPVHDAADTGLDTAATVAETATAPLEAQLRGDGVSLVGDASASSEWVLKQAGRRFVLQQAYDDGDVETPGPVDPPIAATLVADGGSFRAAGGALTTAAAQLQLVPAKGCATWTETALGIRGPVARGATPYGVTQGYLDAHLHLMSQEFLGGRVMCGRTWHPYGITKALVDCPDHQQAGGHGAVLEDFLAGHNPGTGHDPVGWPTFGYWPNPHSLTHVGTYYRWLERSWRGGQRMLTVLLVENGQLCEVYPLKKNSCDEMTSVRREALRTFELQRYVDAQAGGPGRGFFRIVKDPFQARRVVNQGRLAVVLGIEVSRPLGCREYLGTSSCTDAQVDQRLQEVYDLGVRQMEATNKFDNAFTGVKGDGGSIGVLVNAANDKETGHFWKMGECGSPLAKGQADNRQYDAADDGDDHFGRDSLFGAILATAGKSGAAPLYGQGPQCNQIGLTAQGKVLLNGMVKRGMLFDPDHMSAYARQASLDELARIGYSGVISSHSWADDANYFKILKMGGVVTPYAGDSSSFFGKWELLRTKADPRFLYGVGWGSDMNGFGSQGGPRNPAAGKGVRYPFSTLGGATVSRLTTGQRTWDVNTDGVADYGLYPDWVQDVTVLAGKDGAAFRRDLANGVEAYLQMWERANGITGDSCRSDIADVTSGDLKAVKRGMTPEQVVTVLGQPHTRVGRAFTYCGTGRQVTVRFTSSGKVA
jgi:hypothetical protein